MLLAFDDNLGLPSDLPAALSCQTRSFHELGQMIEGFHGGELDAMFVPAGTLPYLPADVDVVGQAVLGTARSTTMESRLVVAATGPIDHVAQAATRRLGHVNAYCTTSFWAPLITLTEVLPAGQPPTFEPATGFLDLLREVTEGRTDAAMVWSLVLEAHPGEAGQTRQLTRRDGLPAPVIVARPGLPAADRSTLASVLADFTTTDAGGFFTGFGPPDHTALDRFRADMARAQAHFDLPPP